MASKGPSKVPSAGRPSFVMGSRPPDMYAPRVAPRQQGDILKQPPRIQPQSGQRQYGKSQQGFGNTGLTGES